MYNNTNRRYHKIITKRTNYSIRWSIPLPVQLATSIPFFFSWFVDSRCANHFLYLHRPPPPQQQQHRQCVPRSHRLLRRPLTPFLIHIPTIRASRNAHCLNWARWNGWVKKSRPNININYNPRWWEKHQHWCQRRHKRCPHRLQPSSSTDHHNSQ